jgi:3,4-dihydroxyphenylacetate 2,3-dioxygenase
MTLGAVGGTACRARGVRLSDYENAVGTGQVHVLFRPDPKETDR